LTYTDDITKGLSSTKAGIQVKGDLGKEYEITDLGHPNKCLWMSIMMDNQTGDILLYQKMLIEKILDTFGIMEAKPKYTLLPPM
jgi:hypothetical protein